MALNREALASALFTRLKTALGASIQFSARRPMSWDQVNVQPAMLLVKERETAEAKLGMPTKWTLDYVVLLYTKVSTDPNDAHDTGVNQMLQTIEAALERTPAEAAQAGPYANDGQDPYTTLGGLCWVCRINGAIETDGGGLDGQCTTLIPIQIQATA